MQRFRILAFAGSIVLAGQLAAQAETLEGKKRSRDSDVVLKGSTILINGKPVAVEGALPPPEARRAFIIGADGKRFEITKVGPNQWETAGGPLPGVYHYRVVVIDEAGNASSVPPPGLGPKPKSGAMDDLPGAPRMAAPGPPNADKIQRGLPKPGAGLSTPGLAAPKLPPSNADGKYMIKKLPGRPR